MGTERSAWSLLQLDFRGPLSILDRNADLSPLNAFSPDHADVKSEALVHLRRRPTPPLPLEDAEWSSEYDAGA